MNSPVTSADIVAAFPALASVADSVWAFAIPFAYARMNATEWGTMLDYGALLLSAHLAKFVSGPGGASGQGPVTGQAVGGVSQQFAQPKFTFNTAMGSLGATAYGQEYAALLVNTVPRWVVG